MHRGLSSDFGVRWGGGDRLWDGEAGEWYKGADAVQGTGTRNGNHVCDTEAASGVAPLVRETLSHGIGCADEMCG